MKCGSVGSGRAAEDGRVMQTAGLISEVVETKIKCKIVGENEGWIVCSRSGTHQHRGK